MTGSTANDSTRNSQLQGTILAQRKKPEEDLCFQKNLNERVLNSVSDAILVIDLKDFGIISANAAAFEQLKLDKEELIGKTCYQATHHRSAPCAAPNDVCPIQEMLKTQSSVVVEHQHFDQENRRIDVEISVHPVKDKNGKIIQIVHINRDVTKRKEQERQEKAKSGEIQGLFNGIGDLLFVMDKNRIISQVNKATCDAFKKKPEELIGKHCYEIVHGTSCPWPNCPATDTFRTKQTVTKEIIDPNLGIPLLVTTSPILDEKGEIVQVIHIAKDITKMKLAEMELHIAANMFEAASDSILVHDLNGKLVYFNEAAHKTRGYTKEEFQALNIQDLEAPGKTEFFESKMKDLLNKGEATFEAMNLCKDKTVIPVEIHAQVIEFDDQKLVLSEARDISERKIGEEKLRESQEKYETTFESSMDALMLLDEKGFFDCNNATLSLFGYKSVEEFTKNHPADLSPTFQADGTSSLESANQHIKKAMLSGKDSFFWIHKRTDGTAFPADVLLTRIHLKNRDVLQATVRNISESKKAEDEKNRLLHDLRERVKELNCIYGVSKIFEKSDFELEVAMTQTVKLFSSAMQYPDIACAKIVVDNQEFSTKNFKDTPWTLKADIKTLGKNIGFVAINYLEERSTDVGSPFLNEEKFLIEVVAERLGKAIERKQAEQRLKEAEEKHRTLLNVANVLVQSVDAKGKYLFVNEEWKKVLGYTDTDLEKITIMDVVPKDHLPYCMSVFKDVMNGLSIHDVETVFVTKDGREIVVSGNACPVFKDDKFVSIVAFFVDITERKKNEEKLKENSQRIELMVEKLRVVGSLTRHDVRNKLSTVTGYAYLLKKKHANEADIVEGLSKMEQSIKETVKIFEFAKMYEQLGVEELSYINVEGKLTEAITLFSGELPKIINDCQGLTVLADSFLRQLFYNFIDNTRKYGKKTTTIIVHYEKTAQDTLKLIYEDNGIGIPLENKPSLFKEGFSTGGSTGFGLFLTKKMMDVYSWEIEENGTPDEGAKFTITIPKISPNGKNNFQIT